MKRGRTRDQVYFEALRKQFFAERLRPDERRELRRRRLDDGSHPLPAGLVEKHVA